MTQPGSEKTFRMAVKLVSTDGQELPFQGFILIPEQRLKLLETVASAARDVVARNRDAAQDAAKFASVRPAVEALGNAVSELEKIWDIS